MMGSIVKELLMMALRKKYPGAKVEFRVKEGELVRVVEDFDITADFNSKRLTVLLDVTDAPIEAQSRRVR